MIFSDNVPLEDEKSLKEIAAERGLLLMGPDCGTAIIGGIPLGFANMVRRGAVGVVGASGTGIQEVTSLIDRYGGGVSHAIGTGSRDLSEEIGGAMTIEGLRALSADPSTQIIVVVSKPPHPAVAKRVAAEAQKLTKPVVLCFVGQDMDDLQLGRSKATAAPTLEEAARRAVSLSGAGLHVPPEDEVDVRAVARQMASGQRYMRGLFSGGTFCYEAMLILQASLGKIYSNTPLSPDAALGDVHRSVENTCLDLGADEFTVGRPHPMIDLSTRAERIVQEAADPEVAVLLLDVVLGYGTHLDPAGVLAGAIEAARKKAAGEGRTLAIVASICGTHADPQGFESQRNALLEAGALVAGSNAAAARLAAQIAGLRSAN
jgi:succinyl-CoA synthetase alpha subunit